jgi:hypothetical protein
MLRLLILLVLASAPYPSIACSAVACIASGPEFHSEFVVVLRHDGKSLPGAGVTITSYTEGIISTRFSAKTASNGSVRVSGLPPGEYWLQADFLGITAAYHCFHLAQTTSRAAKQRVTYEWGDFASTTREAAGRMVDSQPGTGGSPLWNLIHRVEIPISGSRLKLQDPFTGATFVTESDMVGAFAFRGIPDGLYVLHAEGGTSNRDFDATDQLIRLTPKAKGNKLILTKRDAGGGDCGGTTLEVAAR